MHGSVLNSYNCDSSMTKRSQLLSQINEPYYNPIIHETASDEHQETQKPTLTSYVFSPTEKDRSPDPTPVVKFLAGTPVNPVQPRSRRGSISYVQNKKSKKEYVQMRKKEMELEQRIKAFLADSEYPPPLVEKRPGPSDFLKLDTKIFGTPKVDFASMSPLKLKTMLNKQLNKMMIYEKEDSVFNLDPNSATQKRNSFLSQNKLIDSMIG